MSAAPALHSPIVVSTGDTALFARRFTSRHERSAATVTRAKRKIAIAATIASMFAAATIVQTRTRPIIAIWTNPSSCWLSWMSIVALSDVKRERVRPDGVASYHHSGA